MKTLKKLYIIKVNGSIGEIREDGKFWITSHHAPEPLEVNGNIVTDKVFGEMEITEYDTTPLPPEFDLFYDMKIKYHLMKRLETITEELNHLKELMTFHEIT